MVEKGEKTFMVVGEYPDEYQDDSFRSDVKVLDFCDTLKEAHKMMKKYEKEGYELLNIYEAVKVVQGF